MALQATVQELDNVPEALRSEYVEKDGSYHLNVEGMVDKSKLDDFRTNNVKLLKDIETLQGKFKNANIGEGFIITRVDKIEVKDVDQLLKILSEKKNEGVLLQGIYPNGRNAYYGVGL